MLLSEVAIKLDADEIVTINGYDPEIKAVCVSDLLSDILASGEDNFVLLTGLVTPQVVRAGKIAGALGIIIVRGHYPKQELIGAAKAHGMPLYVSKYSVFESCIRLKDSLLEGDCECRKEGGILSCS